MSKNILVTGVSQGLGLAISSSLAEAGWSVYGVSRRHSPEYAVLQGRYPDRVHFHEFDLGCVDRVKQDLFGRFVPFGTVLHGYVNNAAMAYDDLVTNLDANRLRAMYEVNVFAPMMVTKYAIRHMLLHRVQGSVIHISSISAHTGYKGLAMYASTKGALEAFSKNTAREWGERGIRSNCLVAGFMETAMSDKLNEEQRQRIYNRTALKQATKLDSVADTVAFLLGDGATSITGQNIFVDSGTI
ncbi:MAG: SDR family oxidoreductase [Candidatus Didemnitutus sp.]|nr:SDR family oxidoreductase [Candidatus Didemnitutus sp.]